MPKPSRVCSVAKLVILAQLLLNTWIDQAAAAPPEPQIKVMKPGQNITVWSGWNVSGTVHLKIDGGVGRDCVRLWWIRAGLNSDSWEVCDSAEVQFKLPLIYGELRAGHAIRETALAVSDNAIAETIELCGRVIPC